MLDKAELGMMRKGDRIKFHAAARGAPTTATRRIKGFTADGKPFVRFNGWDAFIVRPSGGLPGISS